MSRFLILTLAVLTTGCSNASTGTPQTAAPVERAESTITADDIRSRIDFLADDRLRGRNTPSPGLDTAAAWIASEFARFGLEPGAEDGGWIQRFPYPLQGLDARETRFEISAGATHTLEYGVDFFAEVGASPAQSVGVVYVGDAESLSRVPEGNLRDRAAVVRVQGVPESARGGLRLPREARQQVAQAREAAADAGAAAVVFVLDEGVGPDQVAALAETAAQPGRTVGGMDDTLPAAFFVTRDAAHRLFQMSGLDGTEHLRRQEVRRPVPLAGVTVRVGAPARSFDRGTGPNVVGVLRGSDPELRDTYVVLSAHIDHVGVGRPVDGDSIYNGADDDASGTSAMIEVAEALASLPEPPARSVMFVGVSGEEKGLLGSRWFVDHPPVPLESMVANLNLDMVGRNAPDSIVVIGQEYSDLGAAVHEVARSNPDLGLTISEDLWPEERFFFRSDHFSFAAKEIPALFFFAGTHEDYHRPGDEVEDIDADKNARVARLVFLLAHRLAEDATAPEWDPAGLREVRRLTGGGR